ncbi:MAG: hypothetical protein HYZ49_12400 [Chloroflexi bacterium]|nr:hypothetical protein [Chloroflexota bacterium]
MSSRTFRLFIPLIGAIFISFAIWLFWVDQANAQCGSQASSCKNCHEVQGQLSVNNDGTGWHQSHAFGDFCANCHAGNVQATEADAAHTGMVAPLSDLNANCAACHPSDLADRGQVYASILGVTLDAGGTNPPAASGGDSSAPAADSGQPSANPPASPIVVNDAEVIDYAQRYEQTANGALNVNWGNVIVGAMIVLVLASGGSFVYFNERKLRGGVAVTKPKAATDMAASTNPADYLPEVVALLPQIAKLNPVGIHALKRLLEATDPDDASELLHSLSRLDPELVHRIRNLDRDSRALLMGLARD